MKIYIGPYPGNKSKKKEQTVRVKIDRYDSWSADSTLAYIILPVLKQLKKDKHGSPFVDLTDVPANLHPPKGFKPGPNYDTDKNFHKRWTWVLNEMIWAFTQINTDWGDKYRKGKIDLRWVPIDAKGKVLGKPIKLEDKSKHKDVAFWRMAKGPKDTYKVDRKGMKIHMDRIVRGTTFFGKYYQALWD